MHFNLKKNEQKKTVYFSDTFSLSQNIVRIIKVNYGINNFITATTTFIIVAFEFVISQ